LRGVALILLRMPSAPSCPGSDKRSAQPVVISPCNIRNRVILSEPGRSIQPLHPGGENHYGASTMLAARSVRGPGPASLEALNRVLVCDGLRDDDAGRTLAQGFFAVTYELAGQDRRLRARSRTSSTWASLNTFISAAAVSRNAADGTRSLHTGFSPPPSLSVVRIETMLSVCGGVPNRP